MNEQEYILALQARWPEKGDASLKSIALADEAVRFFPKSSRLWVMRGDLIQLGPRHNPHPLDEALVSYRRAVELDPKSADAWDEIGHYHDAVLNDEVGAKRFFEIANKLRIDGVPNTVGPIAEGALSEQAIMKFIVCLTLLCLLCVTSCRPLTGSAFLAGFNPGATLNKIGGAERISYSAGSGMNSGMSGSIEKNWTFGFQGSHAQLLAQLNSLRMELERQLSSNGCTIHGRGTLTGDFSGFSFEYNSLRVEGTIRVTGVSFESGRQGVEIFVYEH